MTFSNGVPQGSKYAGASSFSRPAFQTQYFVGNSLLLICVLALLGFVTARYWTQLPSLSVFLFAGVAFGLISFWVTILRTHFAYHKLTKSGQLPESRSREDLAMGTIAALCFQALLSISGLVMLCLMALVEILRTR